MFFYDYSDPIYTTGTLEIMLFVRVQPEDTVGLIWGCTHIDFVYGILNISVLF